MSDLPSNSTGSSVQIHRNTENVEKVDLVGRISHQITGAKLPSNRQQILFYNMRLVDRQLRASAKLAISAALIFDVLLFKLSCEIGNTSKFYRVQYLFLYMFRYFSFSFYIYHYSLIIFYLFNNLFRMD